MNDVPTEYAASLAPVHDALQHRPRPLPLFLDMLREQTACDPDLREMALTGLRRYQAAARQPRPPAWPIVAQAGRAVLRDGGGAGPPVVLVPSLINPPHVMDLAPDNSLLRHLAQAGLHPLLVDWGTPDANDRDLDAAGHVEALLLPLIEAVGEPVALVGYCLGGTLALAAAALRPATRLALIAAPWHFTGFPRTARGSLGELWSQVGDASRALGLLPMEVMQTAFWRLDPRRTIEKYACFAGLNDGEPSNGFVLLEDWANDGPPLTHAVARDLMEKFFTQDQPGRGVWQVGGHDIALDTIGCPVLDIVSTVDRIVPAASAVGIGQRLTLGLGHVGMMVGRRARAQLWQPLGHWLSQAQ